MFAINQRVVCCNDDFSNVSSAFLKFYSAFPVRNQVYTVRDITQGIGGEAVCLLHQIHDPPNSKGVENGYNVERFAPLEDVKFSAAIEQSTLASFTL